MFLSLVFYVLSQGVLGSLQVMGAFVLSVKKILNVCQFLQVWLKNTWQLITKRKNKNLSFNSLLLGMGKNGHFPNILVLGNNLVYGYMLDC